MEMGLKAAGLAAFAGGIAGFAEQYGVTHSQFLGTHWYGPGGALLLAGLAVAKYGKANKGLGVAIAGVAGYAFARDYQSAHPSGGGSGVNPNGSAVQTQTQPAQAMGLNAGMFNAGLLPNAGAVHPVARMMMAQGMGAAPAYYPGLG